MAFTAVEKVLMKHSVDPVEKLSPGDFVTARIDYTGFHEGNDAVLFRIFEEAGELEGVWDPQKVGMFLSHHFCTAISDHFAENQKISREWARKMGIRVFDFGSGNAQWKEWYGTRHTRCAVLYYFPRNLRNSVLVKAHSRLSLLSESTGEMLGALGVKDRVKRFLRFRFELRKP